MGGGGAILAVRLAATVARAGSVAATAWCKQCRDFVGGGTRGASRDATFHAVAPGAYRNATAGKPAAIYPNKYPRAVI